MISDLNTNRQSSKTRKGYLHPSSAAYCLNKQIFEFLGIETQISPELEKIFAIGHMVHDKVQTAWRNAGILYSTEQILQLPEYYISGHADGIGVWNGQKFVLEIKSINSNGFKGNLPKREHIEQVQIYMWVLELPVSVILYINKDILNTGIDLSKLSLQDYMNGQWFRMFNIYYDSYLIERRKQIYTQLKWYIDNNQIISSLRYDPNNNECLYCAYANYCQNMY